LNHFKPKCVLLTFIFPGLPNFWEIRIELLRSETYDDVHRILNEIAEKYAEYMVSYENVSLK